VKWFLKLGDFWKSVYWREY